MEKKDKDLTVHDIDVDISLDRSEQDNKIIESGGKKYIRDKRHERSFTEVQTKSKPKDGGFRSGNVADDVKRIWPKE